MIYPVGAQQDDGFRLRARCSGDSDDPPRLEVEVDGTKDDGLFIAEVFNPLADASLDEEANTSPAGFPTDGDLDNGDSFSLIDDTGPDVAGVNIRHGERNVGSDGGTVVNLQAVTRVKESPLGAPTPTQGNCAFVGTVITAEP